MESVTTQSVLTPPLKWAGGKRWLVPILRELYAPYIGSRFVEPFAGGLAAALGVQPRRALLCDVNPALIGFYQALQRGLRVRSRMLNDKLFYYRARERFNSLLRSGRADDDRVAALFYYLNRTGYNGLCRFNRKGEFNVPFGRYRSIRYRRDFSDYQEILRQWHFRTGDFSSITLRPGDFVYVDPPYDVEFRQYSGNDFSWDDQVRLVEWLSAHPGPVVASNQATPRIIRLYREAGFKLRYLDGPRRISCNGNREPAREILAVRGS